jgi:hypothetical protein
VRVLGFAGEIGARCGNSEGLMPFVALHSKITSGGRVRPFVRVGPTVQLIQYGDGGSLLGGAVGGNLGGGFDFYVAPRIALGVEADYTLASAVNLVTLPGELAADGRPLLMGFGTRIGARFLF